VSSENYIVKMQGITKQFPGVLALDSVDFQLCPGEVHVLLGENGAGKSTLIKVLSGAHQPDSGRITVDNKPVEIDHPQTALGCGLRFIYQEINLIQEIDIARNMFLGMEPLKFPGIGVVDQQELYKKAGELLEKFHIDMDPHTIVGDLSVTQQKMIEIARALVTDARALILDEPTDVLEDQARNDLFEVISKLKTQQNVGFIYISHRYQEVYELGDRVTILRDGRNAGTYNLDQLTLDEMFEKMIGGQVDRKYPDLPAPQDENALELQNITRGSHLNDVSLEVKKGEILGVTGLMGAGKTELGRAIAGIDKTDSGKILIHGEYVKSTDPAGRIRDGIAYLTEDRKVEGVILDQSIRNNYALPSIDRLSKSGLVDHKKIDGETDSIMQELIIKAPNRETLAGQLSGGNQQKVVLAKWLGANCKVLLFDEPTRGVDIRGRQEVYRIMRDLLKKGVAIIMFTSDYTEALEMSHRLAVLHHGKIRKVYKRGEVNEDEILKTALGV